MWSRLSRLGRAVKTVEAGDHFLDARLLDVNVDQLVLRSNAIDQVRHRDGARVERHLERIAVAMAYQRSGNNKFGRLARELNEQPALGEGLAAQNRERLVGQNFS